MIIQSNSVSVAAEECEFIRGKSANEVYMKKVKDFVDFSLFNKGLTSKCLINVMSYHLTSDDKENMID